MVYKEDFIYNIYCGTHVTDGVTDDMVWIQGTMMPWFNTRLGPEKRKKEKVYIIYLLYILYVIYIVNILYACYISYILHIYVVKSEWYIKRTSFSTYIMEPT